MIPATKYFPSTYCLERAAECSRLAALAGFPDSKVLLLELAQRWRAMAVESLGDDFKPIGTALHPSVGGVI